MTRKLLILLLAIIPAIGLAASVEKPTVEMQSNPEGISVEKPRFSWQISGDANGIVQTAYKIDVAESEEYLRKGKKLVWCSGRVDSDESVLRAYGGSPLKSGEKYFWQVTVWTNKGDKLKSRVQSWSTAISQSDWKASWIGLNDSTDLKVDNHRTVLPARYLRKEFRLKGKPARAMLYISGIGSSYCSLNGCPVGNDVFGPLPTWYDASVPYLTYDVTSMLRKGGNAIGVELGNGRYMPVRVGDWMLGFGLPRMIAQIVVEYANGKTDVIVSDGTWKVTNQGPIRGNNEFDGEYYDARMELGGWSSAGYDDSSWRKADLMEVPKGKLVAQMSPSLKVMEEIPAVSVKKVGDDRYIVDMGQNMVGLQHVNLVGKAGKPVTMRFAEVLKDNGTELYLDNLRSAKVTDTYVPSSDGYFSWQPRFVYHGYRFMEITGVAEAPEVGKIAGLVVYDGMSTTGRFSSSNAMLDRIHKNAYWGIRSNYRGMPTDCPQRDERLGWLGDRTTGALGESFIFDNALLYNKWLVDIEESMNENGSISDVSPRYWTFYHDDVSWPAAYFYVAEMLYRQYGDDSSIRNRYPSMKRWVDHMVATAMKDYIMVKDTYGDWCMPPESLELIHSEDPARKTSGEVISTTVFYSILRLMENFAKISGNPGDADGYASIAEKMKEAYNKKFFDPAAAHYDNNTVTANLLSLRLGLVPEGYEQRVFDNVVRKTEVDCNGHVSVGVLGIQHLMRGLTEHGALELAYKIATNETYPSWGYMINRGATTIWELWNGDTANPAMNSRNHVMLLGDLMVWYYEDLAGIKNSPESKGFKHILMQPSFPEKLESVSVSHDSPYGRIESSWKRKGDSLEWKITIPANSSATVKLPAKFDIGGIAAGVDGVRSVAETGGVLTVELGSGNYVLKSK